MPRTARIVLPNYPHHIIQRGHNRQVVFTSDDDYRYYLNNLKEFKIELGCKVFTYCLMNNHVHMIIDPGNEPGNLAMLMKRVSGRQTRYTNKLKDQTGTLWESRYKSSAIDADNYLLTCCRYIEMNPVRAGVVDRPEKYRWSSYRCKIGLERPTWLDLDPCYLALGKTVKERVQRYLDWINDSIPQVEYTLIRQAVQRGQLTGDEHFIEEVYQSTGKWVDFRGRGRPKRRE